MRYDGVFDFQGAVDSLWCFGDAEQEDSRLGKGDRQVLPRSAARQLMGPDRLEHYPSAVTHICGKAESKIGLTRIVMRLYSTHCRVESITKTLPDCSVVFWSNLENIRVETQAQMLGLESRNARRRAKVESIWRPYVKDQCTIGRSSSRSGLTYQSTPTAGTTRQVSC